MTAAQVYAQLRALDRVEVAVPVVPYFSKSEDRNQFLSEWIAEKPQQRKDKLDEFVSRWIAERPQRQAAAATAVEDDMSTYDLQLQMNATWLHWNLRQLKSVDEVIGFWSKLDIGMREAMQRKIEAEQTETAQLLQSYLPFEDEAEAEQAWQHFSKQFPTAAEAGRFMSTPTREWDIKYRWRRLKRTLEIDSDLALQLVAKDASPLFVDPDFIARTWTTMCLYLEGGKEEALRDLALKHPGSLIADASALKGSLGQAKFMSAVIDATRGVFSWAREFM